MQHGRQGSGENCIHEPLLVVDDQDDVRQMICTALEVEGYRTLAASTAREGLECLRRHRIGMVITDYAMPGETGYWMLNEAARLGWLDGIPALIVTATPEKGSELAPYPVIGKPFDLETLLDQVRQLLQRAEGQRAQNGAPAGGPTDLDECRIELVLYVCRFSLASAHAQRNLLAILSGYEKSQVRLWIHDLTLDPVAGEADRIVFTPTLVKRWPAPAVWIIGALENADVLTELLIGCGVDSRTPPPRRFH